MYDRFVNTYNKSKKEKKIIELTINHKWAKWVVKQMFSDYKKQSNKETDIKKNI